MSPVIRPFNPPVIQPQAPAAKPPAEARAAQRAFFQQALGDPTPVRTAPPVSAPVIAPSVIARASAPAPTATAQVTRTLNRPLPEEPPTRIMRPGSFVDVKV